MGAERFVGSTRSASLVDVLDRVLDKGLVVAGDIKVSLAEVELLTIRIRLIVCSLDKAQQIGLDWWKHDRHLSIGKAAELAESDQLRAQLHVLDRKIAALEGRKARGTSATRPKRPARNKREGVDRHAR